MDRLYHDMIALACFDLLKKVDFQRCLTDRLLSQKKLNYQFNFWSHTGDRGFLIFSWERLWKLRGIRRPRRPRTKLIFPDPMRLRKRLGLVDFLYHFYVLKI